MPKNIIPYALLGDFELCLNYERKRMTKLTANNSVGERLTNNPTPTRINLSSLASIRFEMGKVYRDMRSGDIDTQDGSRLIYSLSSIGKMLEAEQTKQLQEVIVVDTQHVSLLDGINLNALTNEQLDSLENAVKTIDSMRANPLS